MLCAFHHDETGTTIELTNIYFFPSLLFSFELMKKYLLLFSFSFAFTLSTFVELNEFFERTFNKHREINEQDTQQEKRKEENGWETRSMQWRITSFQHFFPPGKGEFVGKEITKQKKGKRTLDTNFQRCFHLHFNADLITSNAIKEG